MNQSGDITIEVRQSDIVGAIPKSTRDCPVARAITRQLHARKAVVGGGVTVYDSNGGADYQYPYDVAVRIAHFDSVGKMEPFSFTMTKVH